MRTEEEWLTSTDDREMVYFLANRCSARKFRLIGCAACRLLWPLMDDPRCHAAVELSELFADHQVERAQVIAARKAFTARDRIAGRERARAEALRRGLEGPDAEAAVNAWACAWDAAQWAALMNSWEVARRCMAATTAAKLRPGGRPDVGPCDLARDVVGNPFRPVVADPAWLTPAVVSLAASIYSNRSLDALPVLADALEEAGCDSEPILAHCREGGTHVRGCWALDLALSQPAMDEPD